MPGLSGVEFLAQAISLYPDAKRVLLTAYADTDAAIAAIKRLRLHQPSLAELAEYAGLKTRAAETFYDLAIVGGGPAGLAAAVYGASEGLRRCVASP